jgi:hypothetical protein
MELNNEHKTFVVTCLAQFMTPSEVVAAVKEEFEVEITRQQVRTYNPEQVSEVGKEWVKLFKAARAQFIKDTSSIAIAHSAFRLRELGEMYREAKKHKLGKSQRAILEQAAKESGGAYTNQVKQELTGKDGGPVRHEVKPVVTDYRAAASALAPKPEPQPEPRKEKGARKTKPKPE